MFCRQCGQSLVHDGMFCANCGAPIPVEDRERMRMQKTEEAAGDARGNADAPGDFHGESDASGESAAAGASENSGERGPAGGSDVHNADAAGAARLVFGDDQSLTPPELPKIDTEPEAADAFERPVPKRGDPPGWEREENKRDDRPPQYQPQPQVKSSYGGGTTGYGGSGGYGGGVRSHGWANRSETSDAYTDTGEPRPIRPTSYLVPNIIVSILCCPMNILGIIGIIFSILGNSRYDQGNYVDARNYAMVGMVLFWVTLGLGVLSWIGLGTFWGSLQYMF